MRGRLPKKPPAERFDILYLSAYLLAPLPPPVYPVDVSGGITDWGMLGNGPDPTCTSHPDGVGDCTFAGRQHYRMAKAAAAGETESWESSNQLVAEYLAYDHGKDQDAQIADLLLYWYKKGTILAFAPLDHTGRGRLGHGGVPWRLRRVNLTDDADSLFKQGESWMTANGEQSDPNDGHCIVKVAADGSTLDRWVTWGAEQRSTLAWTTACLDEAWVIISSEDAEATNLNLAHLRADIDALHGTGGGAAAR